MMTVEELRKAGLSQDGTIIVLMEIIENIENRLCEVESRHDYEDEQRDYE
jgi:hypothetical protein